MSLVSRRESGALCPNGRDIVKGVTATLLGLLPFTSVFRAKVKRAMNALGRSRQHFHAPGCAHSVESTRNAARVWSMATSDDEAPRGGASGDAPAVDFALYRARRHRLQLLDLLAALLDAVERRDLPAVRDMLEDDSVGRSFPADVRQEALMMARLPRGSLRAPIRAYQFHHQLQQLADEPMPLVVDPRQLSLDLPSTAGDGRFIPFPNDPRRGGTDRRRSGSR